MKALHVIPSISSARGGPSIALAELARGLHELGVQVDVATTDDNGIGRIDVPHGVPIEKHGFSVIYFPRQSTFYTSSWPLTAWLAKNVHQYDVVHIHALFSYAAIPAALFAARAGVPYVVRPLGTLNRWGMERRRPFLKRASFGTIERRILAGASAIHYTSEQERLEAERLGTFAPGFVIPLGVDMRAFDTLPRARRFLDAYPDLAGRKIVLFLSRIDQKKGLDLLLPAFAALTLVHPDAALVIAGNGKERFAEDLRAMARALGIEDAITWSGFLTGEAKRAAFAMADVFVLPSYSENFGVAPVEAMAAGVPVIVSDQVAVSAHVQESGCGLVVPCEVERLAQALLQFFSDPDSRSHLGKRAHEAARRFFSIETTSRDVLDLYRRLVPDGRKFASLCLP